MFVSTTISLYVHDGVFQPTSVFCSQKFLNSSRYTQYTFKHSSAPLYTSRHLQATKPYLAWMYRICRYCLLVALPRCTGSVVNAMQSSMPLYRRRNRCRCTLLSDCLTSIEQQQLQLQLLVQLRLLLLLFLLCYPLLVWISIELGGNCGISRDDDQTTSSKQFSVCGIVVAVISNLWSR